MKKLNISSKINNYEVNFISNIDIALKKESKEDIFIIDKFINSKIKLNRKKIIISPSEIEKNFSKLQNVIQKLLNLGITRDTKIICVGGGVVQDISSFLSSVIFRGIDWYFYPTTIISQCDSCIGGKTSINFKGYKNLIGNFYPPKKIKIDTNILKFLKKKEIISGLGEMAHYYFLSKKKYQFFFDNIHNVLKNKIVSREVVYQTLVIKKKFIELDEFDTGKRLILNFGHTFGHAIEKTTNFKVPHGVAVAHGIQIALFFSKKLGLLNESKYITMNKNIKKITSLISLKKINLNNLIKNINKDKKHNKKNFRFILTRGVGKMMVYELSKKTNIKKILKEYFENYAS
tara:strand:+ start:4818 stop:5855 length:1038 start_codon:yes stop_codon:yes gene_type:complete